MTVRTVLASGPRIHATKSHRQQRLIAGRHPMCSAGGGHFVGGGRCMPAAHEAGSVASGSAVAGVPSVHTLHCEAVVA
jgi:hypothetical protein